MDAWRDQWRNELAAVAGKSLEEIKDAIGSQPELYSGTVESLTDADLRAEMEMFGRKGSRDSWLVWMVLCHYVAYRVRLSCISSLVGMKNSAPSTSGRGWLQSKFRAPASWTNVVYDFLVCGEKIDVYAFFPFHPYAKGTK
jgi:hypothetical protein